jgi:prepilin-type N-terminal cleavage/methylation domain-containing protein
MKRRGRKGFTLVELLVVITIISMLMALLMPAVQSARESGRRAVCLNNQKNLALALLNYESARRSYPGFVEYLGAWGKDSSNAEVPFAPDSGGVVGEVTGNVYATDLRTNDVTWTVAILPYLDRNDLWKAWSDRNVHSDQESNTSSRPRVSWNLFYCPSDPPEQTSGVATPMAYVVNCGLPDDWTNAATTHQLDAQYNGVFHDHSSRVTPSSSLRKNMSLDYLSQHDGSTYTLLLSENIQATSWIPYVSDTNKRRLPYEHDIGMVWATTPNNCTNSDAGYPAKINDCIDNGPNTYRVTRPSSRHVSGVVASFCDGHQQFVSEMIEWEVYCHMMTPDSKKAGLTGVLNPDDIH